MLYAQIILALASFCSNDYNPLACQGYLVRCMEEEKQKDKDSIKLYELYFKTCIIRRTK